LRPDFPDDLPEVWADPLRARQITLNLMSNAIKFTESGSVTLSARAEGDFVRISVSDTGIGIPEAALATIFDRFQQAEHDTDKRYGGTGLGLDISKQLTVMHGGEMTVQSVVGQGSTFSFTLPVSKEAQIEPARSLGELGEEVAIFAPSSRPAAEPQIILVVEDEVSMRDMLRRTLEAAGHAVVDTHDGSQALELAAALLPSLIILDVRLPETSGWEVLQSLKDTPDTASIPVIVCTVDEDSQRAMALGASLYLRKPIIPEEVLAAVQRVIASVPAPESEQRR
jgi:CheY-like chemotaxis protein